MADISRVFPPRRGGFIRKVLIAHSRALRIRMQQQGVGECSANLCNALCATYHERAHVAGTLLD